MMMPLAVNNTEHATGELILVADSDRTSRHLLVSVLERAGFNAVEATNGDEALEHVTSTRPSAAVLDLHLADRAAIDVIRRLRANPATRTLPTVLVAGDHV